MDEIEAVDEDDEVALITICRDMPGEHTGGPDCFCFPGTFAMDDDVGIQEYLERGQFLVS